eukprot:Tamp_21410.p1 GENE.Tamp_21410~~Tamp_21410.p1  ORF type:complete len:362 (+),score=70.24 Tamp_21410:88-1086(+)
MCAGGQDAGSAALRQRYWALAQDGDDTGSGSDGDNVGEARAGHREALRRTRRPLDTSWASIGRDVVEVFRRLPEDVAYLLHRLPDGVRGLKHPRELCLKICLVLAALTWFWNNVHVLQYLDLRQQIYGLHMHKHDSSEVIRYSPQNPYAFLDRWPRSIQEDRPEHCSFRQQEKMRKKLNHLSVRLGLGLPDSKRSPDTAGRLGIQVKSHEHPTAELDYMTHASTLFRGIPTAHQAHVDEYYVLNGLLQSCDQVFGKIFRLGDEQEHVASSKPEWSQTFQRLHEEEGEQARIKEEALELARLRKKQEEEERATGLQWEEMSGRDEKRGESRGP